MTPVIQQIHHLSCLTMCPAGGRIPGLMPRRLVAHCLLVEMAHGLLLVDTGMGLGDVANPARLGPGFVRMTGARLTAADTAVSQVRALGLDPDDVRDVVLTHLDLDHAGGIGDFPNARVHVHADELAAARARRTPRDKGRYVPAQWAHGPQWVEHAVAGGREDWLGFDALPVLGAEVLMVPLRGHTLGHSGVAVARPGGGWLLHAGDAYFYAGEKETPRSCPPGLRFFQTVVQTDRAARHANQERLRELWAAHRDEVTVFSAHDASEYDALAGQTG